MLAAARAAAPRARFALADLARLPLPDRAAACTICFRFLHHLPPPAQERAVSELARVTETALILSAFHPISAHHALRRVATAVSQRPLPRHPAPGCLASPQRLRTPFAAPAGPPARPLRCSLRACPPPGRRRNAVICAEALVSSRASSPFTAPAPARPSASRPAPARAARRRGAGLRRAAFGRSGPRTVEGHAGPLDGAETVPADLHGGRAGRALLRDRAPRRARADLRSGEEHAAPATGRPTHRHGGDRRTRAARHRPRPRLSEDPVRLRLPDLQRRHGHLRSHSAPDALRGPGDRDEDDRRQDPDRPEPQRRGPRLRPRRQALPPTRRCPRPRERSESFGLGRSRQDPPLQSRRHDSPQQSLRGGEQSVLARASQLLRPRVPSARRSALRERERAEHGGRDPDHQTRRELRLAVRTRQPGEARLRQADPRVDLSDRSLRSRLLARDRLSDLLPPQPLGRRLCGRSRADPAPRRPDARQGPVGDPRSGRAAGDRREAGTRRPDVRLLPRHRLDLPDRLERHAAAPAGVRRHGPGGAGHAELAAPAR